MSVALELRVGREASDGLAAPWILCDVCSTSPAATTRPAFRSARRNAFGKWTNQVTNSLQTMQRKARGAHG